MTNYPTNVRDSGWEIISKYLDTERNRKYDLREIVNGILYVVKTGCQWRMLPGDFAPWKTVYYYFSKWKKGEVFEVIHESLVEKVPHIAAIRKKVEVFQGFDFFYIPEGGLQISYA